MRRIATPNEFFEIMDQIGLGKFVTIGYVSSASVVPPQVRRRNPATKMMKNYNDYTVFQEEGDGEIGALVKVSSWTLRYQNRKAFGKDYAKFQAQKDDIRGRFGLPPSQKKNGGYKETIQHGENGVSTYKGNKEELQGHTYWPFNNYDIRPYSVTYAVDTNGNIMKALSPEQIKPYLKAKGSVEGVSALRKMGVEEEQIQEYIKELQSLKFSYKQFEADSILYIAATVNGEKLVYINSNLTRAVDGININKEDFIKIANKRYAKDMQQLTEMEKKDITMKNKLNENYLHRIIKESVKKILNEGVEFSSENPQEEWAYYQNKLEDEFDELGVMVLNKIPKNDPDRQVVERYIKMIQAHLHALEN